MNSRFKPFDPAYLAYANDRLDAGTALTIESIKSPGVYEVSTCTGYRFEAWDSELWTSAQYDETQPRKHERIMPTFEPRGKPGRPRKVVA